MMLAFSLPNGWFILLAIVAFQVIALYVVAPLRVRSSQTKPLTTTYVPIDLTSLPADISHIFFAASEQLASLGFRAVGHVGHSVARTGQHSFVSVWVNASTGDSAQTIGINTPSHEGGFKLVTLVTFRTEFTDDTSIVTSNSSTASVFPADPKVNSVRCPEAWNIALLYRFHRARVARDQGARTATLEQTKDASSRLVYEHHKTYDRLIRAGYYILDDARQCYVPTYKGAFLMTYRLLTPFKQIQRMRKDRLADRTLRELGFGGMAEFQAMAGSGVASIG